MSRIRGLELLFNIEKKNFKSKEDLIVAVFHCLLVNDKYDCVGLGDEWPEEISSTTELLPSGWNSNQDGYSLRYISKDLKSRILLKLTKMEHILQVDVVKNEDAVASMSVPVENFIENNFDEYSTAYKDLESLSESFRKEIMQKLESPEKKKDSSSNSNEKRVINSPDSPSFKPVRPGLQQERDPYSGGYPRFPRVGGSDLDPFGHGGGMFMDPSSFGVPARPPLSDFGVGGRYGLPRGALPPGARFDPIRPPFPSGRFDPYPGLFKPPDFDDYDYM